MPRRVSDLLGNRHALQIWRLVPLCLMWCLWPERNAKSFENHDSGLLEIKNMMLQSQYTWKVVWNSVHVANFFGFLELCFSFSII